MCGPMARSTDDLALALDLTSTLPLPRSRHDSFKGVRILVLDHHPVASADSATRSALRAAADAAANAGAIISNASAHLPDREAMHVDYVKLLNIALSARQPPDPDHPEIGVKAWMGLLDKQADMIRLWQRLFEDFDAIFTPVFGTAAFPHIEEQDWFKRSLLMDGADTPFLGQICWIGQATYTNLPAVSVPVGSDGHLPIGIQVITPHWQDHSAIALAGMLHNMMLER